MGRSKITKRRYDSLLERSLVSAQKQELILQFELSQESWLAETVVQEFNKQMNDYESKVGLHRMQPGCLLVSFRDQLLQIPLLTEDWATLLAQGQSFINHRKRVSEQALSCFKAIDPSATMEDVFHYINRRSILHPWAEGECKRANISYSGKLINPAKVNVHPPRRISTDEVTIPIEVRNRLLDFLVSEAGVAPSQAAAMLQFLAARREAYCPPVSQLNPGQVLWLSFSSTKKKPSGVQFARRIVMPIILTLFTEEELKRPIATLPELNKLHSEQSARILVEAYLQGTLIPKIELGLLFLRSYTSMGNLIRNYMEVHQVILPTPRTILDAGRAMTHKHIIVAQSVAGYFTSEIARKTYHTPESVNAYLKVFQSVLILSLYDMPIPLMARVTGRGQALVKEYLELIEEHFPNRQVIKMYLKEHGVAIA